MFIKFNNLQKIRADCINKTIVFAGGTFDIIHRGHVDFLKNLRSRGDIVVIAVSTDGRVKERKGSSRPIHTQKDRALIIDAMRDVDFTTIAPERDNDIPPTIRILEKLKPDHFVTRDQKWALYSDNVQAHGTNLVIETPKKVNSSSRIIKLTSKDKGARHELRF